MQDDLDSSSKGIWILPYEPNEAGPSRSRSRSRPLKQVYADSLRAYHGAHDAYERQRTDEQVDDIADWLDRSSTPTGAVSFHRLPTGIIQQPGRGLHDHLRAAAERLELVGVQGRDMVDVPSAIRSITSGLIGELPSKTGLTGLDQVEFWWKKRKDRSSSILLYIEQAQIVSPQVLAEVMYILTLHPDLPFRLLLSVPSVRTFVSQWSSIEPSSIDLFILSSGRRRRQNPVSNILDASGNTANIRSSDHLAERLKMDETMFGQGPEGALRSLHWAMLHHENNSPLATLIQDGRPSDVGAVQAIVEMLKTDPHSLVPGRDLFDLQTTKDLDHVMDPSPRISILHALANSANFTADLSEASAITPPPPEPMQTTASPSKRTLTPKRAGRKRQKTKSPSPPGSPVQPGSEVRNGDLKELEVLYGLWKGAGKNVNLWDWLQGYQGSISAGADAEAEEAVEEGDEPARIASSRKRSREQEDPNAAETANGDGRDEDREHATFVRFCEEARMLGLVRARGKGVGRRGDEVVKSVTLV